MWGNQFGQFSEVWARFRAATMGQPCVWAIFRATKGAELVEVIDIVTLWCMTISARSRPSETDFAGVVAKRCSFGETRIGPATDTFLEMPFF